MLLATLQRLGYLSADAEGAGVRPTLRVMLLGHWLHDRIFGEGTLLSAVDSLRRHTGETVLIGMRQGLGVRSILALRGTRPGAIRIRPGMLYPVTLTAMGKMLLTLETDFEVARIAAAANTTAMPNWSYIDPNVLVQDVHGCKAKGWSECDDWPVSGRGAIAMLLPRVIGHPPMALAMRADMSELLRRRNDLAPILVT